MIKKAYNLIQKDVDYIRPHFDFPDLNSPQGNPMEYFKMASDILQKHGFRREAKELYSLKTTEYSKHFDIINKFLDFSEKETKIKEDDEYIYVKVKKNKSIPEQPREFFKIDSEKKIKDLINEGYDFSKTNCYGRNILYYLNDYSAIKLLLNENKTKNWFNLFDLDYFNSTILHKKDFQSMSLILNEMRRESVEMTKLFFYGTDIFGKNAFGDFLIDCDNYFNKLKFFNGEMSEKNLSSIASIIATIGTFDTKKKYELISIFDKLSEEGNNSLSIMVQKYVLEHELIDNKSKKQSKKIKL